MESILIAVISAGASIVVALINQGRLRGRSPSMSVRATTLQQQRSRKWILSVIALMFLIVITPIFSTTRQANVPVAVVTMTFSLIVPVLSIVLAYLCAPTPLAAASGVLAIHAVNAGVMSFSTVAGYRIAGAADVVLLLTIFAINAGLAALAARWALSRRSRLGSYPGNVSGDSGAAAVLGSAPLASQLSELARLKAEGLLTEEEYSKAKSKLIG
jgi:hypothetical protein